MEKLGDQIDVNKDFILVLQHPITTEYGQGFDKLMKLSMLFKNFPKKGFKQYGFGQTWMLAQMMYQKEYAHSGKSIKQEILDFLKTFILKTI